MKAQLSYSIALALAALVIGSSPISAQEGFEPPFTVDANNAIGDVGVRGTYQGLTPTQGSNQLLLTTINNASEGTGSGALSNQSGSNAVTAPSVESFLSVPTGTIRNGVGSGSAGGTEGSAFKLTITLGVGDVLTFNYQFLTQEDVFLLDDPNTAAGYHRDFAFASLSLGGSLFSYEVLNTADDALISPPDQQPFPFAADPDVFSFTATQAGTYTLGIGVADATTTDIASGLLVDNIAVAPIPEPSTYALLAGGAFLLVGWRRRRASAKA